MKRIIMLALFLCTISFVQAQNSNALDKIKIATAEINGQIPVV